MRNTTSLRLLLLTVATTPLLAVLTQDPASGAEDWATHVEKACSAKRYGIRLAAARKVAEGGDAAVPAVRAHVAQHGANALPSSLVDSIADNGTNTKLVRELLEQWARDGDFYWRASAMRGLALRAPTMLDDDVVGMPDPRERLLRLFEQHLDDPAWLMRTHARLGVVTTVAADTPIAMRARDAAEPDPRARVRYAKLMLDQGRVPDLQPLLDALADERTFLGDPWGARLGQEAHKALKQWLGADDPFPNGAIEDKAAAIEALRKAAAAKSGQTLAVPKPHVDDLQGVTGGVELLSCKHGDTFVQWTDDGRVRFGIDGARRVQLADSNRDGLLRDRTALALDGDLGGVVCDSMRVRLTAPDVHAKVAPASLPEAAAEWLKRLALALEEAGAGDLADDLRRGLAQFAGS